MLKRFVISLLVLLSFALPVTVSAADTNTTGLKLLSSAPPNALGSFDGVATFGGAKPTAEQLAALRGLGLQVQGFNHLPLAMLRGPKQAMFDAVARGLARDVWPNERLTFFSASSNAAIGANALHAAGVTGAGVKVAVVDSGIDATHPDLVRRVTRNMKIIEQAPAPNIVVAMDTLPYNNSDTSSGHGTHVAGIIAADNTDGQVIGVAPGANLVGYGTGDAIFVFGVLYAFDDIISQGDIRVVNNSWGSSFRLFNPDEPINQATRVLHDHNITVVFAAGNASTEMALNPYSAAPWVISVGNSTISRQRASTSSGGIEFDNSVLVQPLPTADEKHLAFAGDRIGLYHPSVSAPGTNIVSTGTTGAAVTSLPGGTASASGTSMAAPHIAGVVALMLQKNPKLTPAEIKSVLQVTSDLMPSAGDPSKAESFYKVGYGFVNAKAAVDLVGRQRYSKEKALARLQSTRDAQVQGDRDFAVASTDYWSFTAAPATVNGTPDTRTYTLQVPATTKAIKALVSYPSLGYVGVNQFNYRLTLADAAGKTVGVSTAATNAGMSQFFADLRSGTYTYGTWTLTVMGQIGAQDQDVLMGVLVSVAVHQLTPQARVAQRMPTFTATGSTALYFQPGEAGLATSPEGCNQQVGAPVGDLGTARLAGTCQSGNMGYAINYGAGVPASFTSGKLTAPLTVGGPATLKFYLADPLQPAWQAAQSPNLSIEVDAIDDNGDLLMAIGANQWSICTTVNGTKTCQVAPQPVGGTYSFNIPPITIPAGARISVLVRLAQVVTTAARTVYGGRGLTADFSDAGLTLTTGTLQ